MDSAQRELLRVLLEYICSLGLISHSACDQAVDLVSEKDFPPFFQNPVETNGQT